MPSLEDEDVGVTVKIGSHTKCHSRKLLLFPLAIEKNSDLWYINSIAMQLGVIELKQGAVGKLCGTGRCQPLA